MLFFTKNIKYLKSQKNTNVEELVTVLGNTFPYLASGEIQPGVDDLIKLSNLFNVSIDDLLKKDLKARTRLITEKDIRFLVLDVDGTLTDGGMYFTTSGEEIKKFNAKDGRGIINLIRAGFPVALLSSGVNKTLLQNRAKVLGIQYVYAGKGDKIEVLRNWCEELKIKLEQVAYMGDDLNDLTVIPNVGVAACPSDAVKEVKEVAHVILNKKGGEGCVREFIDEYVIPSLKKQTIN